VDAQLAASQEDPSSIKLVLVSYYIYLLLAGISPDGM
jgi:hypothetical protein